MRWTFGRSRASSGSIITLSLLLLFLFVSTAAEAASLSDLPNLSSVQSVGDGSSTATATQSTSDNSKTTSTAKTTQTTNSAKTTKNSDSTTITGADVTLTGGISISSSSSSSQTGSSSIFQLSNLPTVAGATDPTQVVPYTANAPFMQKSNLPEGTVFIIVGAILGFFGVCVLLWRALVAWSLARSVKRAALAQHQTFDLKSAAYPPSGGVYSGPMGSAASMERLSAAVPKSARRKSHVRTASGGGGPVPAYTPSGLTTRASAQNLFFSPTAGAGHPSANPSPILAGNRGSSYLPAGYYASGSSQPAGGSPVAHINAHAAGQQRGSSILNPLSDRLSGMRAESAGYQRAHSFGPSPPASPGLPPSASAGVSRTISPGTASSVVGNVGAGLYSQPSQSSLNLSVPGGTASGGRTPSAYLEDLFENHGTGPRERF